VRCDIGYTLKTAYRDGTTHLIFEPLELMAQIRLRHPAGDLRSSKSTIPPICHRAAGGRGRATAPQRARAAP